MGFRSDNLTVKSPVAKYIEWRSDDKGFRYYDKAKKDQVSIKLPISFVALDDFIGISGGEMDDIGKFHPVTSGIVAHLNKTLVVNKDGNTIATGKWADIKEKVKAEGGRYTVYTYAIFESELVCFKLAGAALAAWFEKGEGDGIVVIKAEQKKKGAITYYAPIFETKDLTDKEIKKLEASDEVKRFDEYAEAKKAQKFRDEKEEEESKEEKPQPNLNEHDDSDDDPF